MKKTGWKFINRRLSKFFSCVVVWLSFIIVIGPGGLAWGQLSDEGSKEIQIFAQQKSKAEDFARMLQKRYEKKKIDEKNLDKGEMLYNDAKATFNGYITKLQLDIKSGRKPSQENLKEALEKSEKFNAFAEEQVYGASRGPGRAAMAVIGPLFSSLTQTGLDIWKEYRRANLQERDGLVKELEKIKWQSFDQIK